MQREKICYRNLVFGSVTSGGTGGFGEGEFPNQFPDLGADLAFDLPVALSTCEPVLLADLCAEHLVNQVARLLDLRYGQGCENPLAAAPGYHHSGRLEDCQVLGDVGLGNAECVFQLADAAFTLAQQVKQVEAGGVGKGLADARLALENFIFQTVIVAGHKLHEFLNYETDSSLRQQRPSDL